MDKIQVKVEELHKLLVKELEDPGLEMVLRACLLVLKKECEALDWALRALATDAVAAETLSVNEQIQADWADPNKQVDPNAPHAFESEASAVEASDETDLD